MYLAKNLQLRPIKRADLPVLLTWRNDKDYIRFCTRRKTTLSSESELDAELRKDFATNRHEQRIIFYKEQPVGTIYSYALNKEDGYIFVTIFVEASLRSRGIGIVAFALFCESLFRKLDLHKIYIDVYAENESVVEQAKRGRLVVEGEFKEHKLVEGRRLTMMRLALYKRQVSGKYSTLSVKDE